ncbi:MAG: glutathione peroxidase [Nitrospinaceae bacterium]
MPDLHDIKATTIQGKEVELSRYRGKVLLIVNVASKCGFTPQYLGLKDLHERWKERDFALLAFPCDDFANQEPGSDAEIKDFCDGEYGVEFDLFSKIKILGDSPHPLYKFLQASKLDSAPARGPRAGLFGIFKSLWFLKKGIKRPAVHEVQWNFHKFLVDREGRPVAHFSSLTSPLDPDLTGKIDEELNK